MIGTKMICVKGVQCLVKGQTYTCIDYTEEFFRVDCCSMPEHQNHCGWFRWRFRRQTDISVFTKMLNSTKVDA